jgi:hypothetical protein
VARLDVEAEDAGTGGARGSASDGGLVDGDTEESTRTRISTRRSSLSSTDAIADGELRSMS